MYYISGNGFDSQAEFFAYGNSISTSDMAVSWASLLDDFCEIEDNGFTKVKHAWDRTRQNEIWTFQDGDVWAALQVPGDGRANTFDVVLLQSAIIGNPTAQTGSLVQSAANRLITGKVLKWV